MKSPTGQRKEQKQAKVSPWTTQRFNFMVNRVSILISGLCKSLEYPWTPSSVSDWQKRCPGEP